MRAVLEITIQEIRAILEALPPEYCSTEKMEQTVVQIELCIVAYAKAGAEEHPLYEALLELFQQTFKDSAAESCLESIICNWTVEIGVFEDLFSAR